MDLWSFLLVPCLDAPLKILFDLSCVEELHSEGRRYAWLESGFVPYDESELTCVYAMDHEDGSLVDPVLDAFFEEVS